MKNIMLMYNPQAGDKGFRFALDSCVQVFQANGYETRLCRLQSPDDLESAAARLDGDCHAVIAAGGDGTINQTVNALMRTRPDLPLGIIPAGTANDFAGYLKMPKDPEEAVKALMEGRTIKADLGRVNGRYFINVCGAGLFTNISQQIDAPFKDALGMLAYYLKGIEQLPSFVPFPVRITTPSQLLEESLYLFIALNGCGAGGLTRLSPRARIDDGMLDFIAFKAVSLRELAVLFVNILKGDFLEDSSVLFLRERDLTIEYLGEPNTLYGETDIDGERGPDMPIHIECVPEAITLIVPEAYR